MLKRLMFVAAAMLVVLSFVGCDTNKEQQRSVLTVSSVNCNAPAYGDVQDDTGGFSPTLIPVEISNRPYNQFVTTAPDQPHGDFLVTSYRVSWETLDGQAVLPDRVEYTGFNVPSGEVTTAFVLLVSLTEKENNPVLTALQGGGTRAMRAIVTFYGHEVGTERDGEVDGSVSVQFANFVDGSANNCSL